MTTEGSFFQNSLYSVRSQEAWFMEKISASELKGACPVKFDSVTLARLIEEVRNEDLSVARSYDRTHNRHNR